MDTIAETEHRTSKDASNAFLLEMYDDARAKRMPQMAFSALKLPPEEAARLPHHSMQTDTGLGTKKHPVNNNCQTTTLKNMFSYFGMDHEAGLVNKWQEQLLNEIRTKHGKDLDMAALAKAFKGDRIPLSAIKSYIEHGKVDGMFQFDTRIAQTGATGSAVSPELETLFLGEMGCKPEQVNLGSEVQANKVLQALDDGKPIFLGDNNTHTLLQEAMAAAGLRKGEPVQGHVYMVYKEDGAYYVSDPGYSAPVKISSDLLRKKLMDHNSQATIINAPPDPSRFLKH